MIGQICEFTKIVKSQPVKFYQFLWIFVTYRTKLIFEFRRFLHQKRRRASSVAVQKLPTTKCLSSLFLATSLLIQRMICTKFTRPNLNYFSWISAPRTHHSIPVNDRPSTPQQQLHVDRNCRHNVTEAWTSTERETSIVEEFYRWMLNAATVHVLSDGCLPRRLSYQSLTMSF